MSQKHEKLKGLLKELFQLDQPDLDFGLYRIMHAKAEEITQFLERDLLPQVKQEFSRYQTVDKAEMEKELAKAIEAAQGLRVDPETTPKVKELRAKLASEGVDIAGLEAEVYDHLFGFFRRYYSDGDFLSKRVYKPGVYAIPYEGEEVKLHWANADQYYIKTSEYLRDYAFRLRPASETNPMRVHFRLADAAEGEHDNVKPPNGKDRVFILAMRDFVREQDSNQGNELVIPFEYRPATLTDWPEDAREGKTKPPAQKDLTALAEKRLLEVSDVGLTTWIAELARPHVKADGERADYSRLRAHLNRYVARNTFDYFIHKDLGTFLRRELDFYIKNEVMHLDDVEHATAPRVEQYLSKIKVIRRIAGKIIAFLAQLEDFQKKLWLKKKFVVETQYCITLDRIPEEFYPAIAANEAQSEEWLRLFAIDEIKGNLTSVGYSKPLKVAFLKSNPHLVLDTAFFPTEFKHSLLAHIEVLDERTDGLLIHSENFQAMMLIHGRFQEKFRCIYIDPPYNTGTDDFPYKDSYQASSWFTMMYSRCLLAQRLLHPDGLFFIQIGDDEVARSRLVLEMAFAERKNSVVVRRGVKNVQAQFGDIDKLTVGHDTVHIFAKRAGVRVPHLRQSLGDAKPGKWDTFWRGVDRPTMRYELFGQNPESGQWRWEDGRAKRAKANYEHYLQNVACSKPLDEWYIENLQAGQDLDFVRLNEEKVVQYYVPPQGFRLISDNWLDISSAGNLTDFPHEKGLELLIRIIDWNTQENDLVLDFFAGSGSTGHAAFVRQPSSRKSRRYVQVEMGSYFDYWLRPRTIKYIYSDSWRDGKPSSRSGISHMFKYIRLESYEDALNNLETRRTGTQQSLLDAADAQGPDRLKEQFLLRYMLNVETSGSQSLLNVQAFQDPTAYRLKVKRPGSDESREVIVDLLETFNWLIGLTVQHIAAPQSFSAKFERDGEKRLRLKGPLKQDDAGPYWFRTVTGATSDGRKTLIIWRKRPGGETAEGIEQDNLVLDEWFTKQGYSAKDSAFDLIYVNGSNNLENLKPAHDRWKVRLIEEDFHRLMFATEDV